MAGCIPLPPVETFQTEFTDEAQVDSLYQVIESQSDYIELRLRSWMVDSLEKRMVLTAQDSAEIEGRDTIFRADWFDQKRLERGRPESKLTTFLDSVWQQISFMVYASRDSLLLVAEEYHYQPMNFELTSIFAVDSTIRIGYKFRNFGEFRSWLNEIEAKHFEYEIVSNTTYYASNNTGDDANDPCDGGWSDACKTIGATMNDVSAGDSVIVVGTFTEQVAPTADGTAGSPISVVDSLVHTNGLTADVPDTTNLWSAIIDGEDARNNCFNFNQDDYWHIIGIDFRRANVWHMGSTTSDGNKYQQCRFRGGNQGTLQFKSGSTADSVISCLILGDSTLTTYPIYLEQTNPGGIYIVNNTIYGSFDFIRLRQTGTGVGTIKNNIVYNTTSTASFHAVDVDEVNGLDNTDYNNWYAPNVTNTWEFNGSSFDVLATWVDSVNNYDVDGAANTINSDPSLNATATTCYTTGNSDGEDLGYGTQMGWLNYAEAGAAPTRRRVIRIGYRPPMRTKMWYDHELEEIYQLYDAQTRLVSVDSQKSTSMD